MRPTCHSAFQGSQCPETSWRIHHTEGSEPGETPSPCCGCAGQAWSSKRSGDTEKNLPASHPPPSALVMLRNVRSVGTKGNHGNHKTQSQSACSLPDPCNSSQTEEEKCPFPDINTVNRSLYCLPDSILLSVITRHIKKKEKLPQSRHKNHQNQIRM